MARDRIAIALILACGAAACRAGGCRKAGGSEPVAGQPLASKPFYRVDAGPPAACAQGATCEVRLVLTALGDYHINQDYPFKFVGEPAPTPPIDGEGAFAIDDARHGTMTVTFHPAAGTAKLVGTFKLCVCSDETCEIETPRIELAVPVS